MRYGAESDLIRDYEGGTAERFPSLAVALFYFRPDNQGGTTMHVRRPFAGDDFFCRR